MGAGEEQRVRIVVLDTNVLVSAFGWNGPERRVYERCRAGELRQSISPDLLLELERVLHYPKLQFTESEIRACLRDLVAHANLVVPVHRIDVIEQDPGDNRVLECAVESGAKWIVSGDYHLLELHDFTGIQILSAAAALQLLGA